MKYCKNCVMPDSKPGVTLDNRGLCNACRSTKIKDKIDWDKRKKQLDKIVFDIKQEEHPFYDCIVPVSGGKDSWYQAMILSDHYKLKVLCVTLAPHLPTAEGIENLNNMLKDLNVDHIKITIKPSIFREIRKRCFLKQGEPSWAEHCAMFSSVINVALIYEVPLVVWGEDISFEFGGIQNNKSKPSALDINQGDLIKGKSIMEWLNDDISPRDVFFYDYPDQETLNNAGINAIYLGHYLRWSGRENFETVKKRGFKSREKGPLSGNYIDYDNIDEKLCEIHIWMKYIKFGFWRSTDQTCYDIWNKKLSRREAVKIVKKLSDDFPVEYFEDFLRFHKLTEDEFWDTVEKFRNHDIWEKKDNFWKLKNEIS